MRIKIDVDIYSMTVVVATTFDEFKALHKTANPEMEFGTADYGQHIYVLVSDQWDSMYNYNFIRCMSHELNHASMIILNYVDVNFGYDNQEPLCYLQDYLMSKVFKVIGRHEKNKLDEKKPR